MSLRSLAALAALWCAAAVSSAQDVTPVIHVPNPSNLLAQQSKHYVVLVSLDGFRYDYAHEHGAPHLDEMSRDGASTPTGMLPSYPPNVGSHGFDPQRVEQMKAIFYAEGPDIKAGVALPTFDNIDVFSFITRLLDLKAPPTDGMIGPLESALK